MTPVLLDTGVVVALLDRSERHHERCVDTIRDLSGPLATCEPVIAEACYLLRKLPGAAEAVLENVRRGSFQLPFRLEDECAPVRSLLRKYASVPMDLADACLVRMADLLGSGRILTLDRDFNVYRWRKVRPFELLVEIDAAR